MTAPTAITLTPEQLATCRERLRREPIEHGYYRLVVPDSLPVLFFGDITTAQVATLGLNPSKFEYLDKQIRELDGSDRRLETLRSLGVTTRSRLTDAHCDAAIARMRAYFQPGKPVYNWFRPLDHLTRGLGFSYAAGTVAHLDLVQEATRDKWSDLHRTESDALRKLRELDRPFLRWQLDTFPIRLLICDGATASRAALQLFPDHTMLKDDIDLIPNRDTWVAATFRNGSLLWLLGWNTPLNAVSAGYGDLQFAGQLLAKVITI